MLRPPLSCGFVGARAYAYCVLHRSHTPRVSQGERSPEELYPEGGKPDYAAIARIGLRCNGWHIFAVLAHSGTDAGFQAYLKQLKALVGNDPDDVLQGMNPDDIPTADLFLAFCWVFHK